GGPSHPPRKSPEPGKVSCTGPIGAVIATAPGSSASAAISSGGARNSRVAPIQPRHSTPRSSSRASVSRAAAGSNGSASSGEASTGTFHAPGRKARPASESGSKVTQQDQRPVASSTGRTTPPGEG